MTTLPVQLSHVPNDVKTGMEACEGRKSITVIIDFSLGLNYSLDLSGIIGQQVWMKSVQTLYVNNVDGDSAIDITMGVTNQHLRIPPFSQAYLPILQSNPPVLNFVNSNPNTIDIQILNFFLPPIVWGNNNQYTPTGELLVSDPALEAMISGGLFNVRTTPLTLAAVVDGKGTITAGGTVQSILAASGTRKRVIISNPDTETETLYIMFGTNTSGRIPLLPGMTWDDNGSTIVGAQIFAVAATTGHVYTLYSA